MAPRRQDKPRQHPLAPEYMPSVPAHSLPPLDPTWRLQHSRLGLKQQPPTLSLQQTVLLALSLQLQHHVAALCILQLLAQARSLLQYKCLGQGCSGQPLDQAQGLGQPQAQAQVSLCLSPCLMQQQQHARLQRQGLHKGLLQLPLQGHTLA